MSLQGNTIEISYLKSCSTSIGNQTDFVQNTMLNIVLDRAKVFD